jgi:hypothetical protein
MAALRYVTLIVAAARNKQLDEVQFAYKYFLNSHGSRNFQNSLRLTSELSALLTARKKK